MKQSYDFLAVTLSQDTRVTILLGIFVSRKIDLGGLIQEQKARNWPIILTEVAVQGQVSNLVVSNPVLAATYVQ